MASSVASPFLDTLTPSPGRRSFVDTAPELLPQLHFQGHLQMTPSSGCRLAASSYTQRKRKADRLRVRLSSSSIQQGSVPEIDGTIGKLETIYKGCKTWSWRGHRINFYSSGNEEDPSLLLVHGFGASIGHWRRNIGVLSENYAVYAIDLLGFGASDKPAGFSYEMEIWAQLILDFLEEVVQKPTVLVGNSVGSLACVIAASESRKGLLRGLVLLNCAGGMNNKAIVDDWRIKLLLPLLLLFDFLLKQQRIASFFFERIKTRENLRNILTSVYGNKQSVDDELVEIIKGPADDEGALDAFVSVVTGPPGPSPSSLITKISIPILVLWGDQDPFTPLDGPVGKYFSTLPSQYPNIQLFVPGGVGHCLHDDTPHLVHEKMFPWLASLSKS